MEKQIAHTLSTLGHPRRLALFRLLMRRYPDKVSAGDIAQAMELKRSTLSAYLSAMMQAGLVTQTRAGTSLYYTVDMSAVRHSMDYLFLDCCRGRPDACSLPAYSSSEGSQTMPDTKLNVLFICSGNSARSIFAEAILREMAGNRFTAYSAGTSPYSELNPEAVALLERKGHDISGLRAKSISEFQGPDAPQMDFVFTVCDRAANEECPPWPGQPVTGHFSTPDPVQAEGDEATRALAFQQAYGGLWTRISLFVERLSADMKRAERQQVVDDAARAEGGAA